MTNKEKKDILLGYVSVADRIDELKQEIETSPECSEILKKELVELIDLKKRVFVAVQNLPDINERRVMHLIYIGAVHDRCHYRLTMWQVANIMHYSVDSIKKMHSRALMHLEL